MTSEGIAKELIKSDKRTLFPLFAFTWLTFALFELKTGLVSITVATEDANMPVYIGLLMVFTWFFMLYKPPPERRQSRSRDVSLSHVTRNIVDRVGGNISHNGHNDWMLFTDAANLPTDHHGLPDEKKNATINGLQLDLAHSVGMIERAVLGTGETIIRRVT